MATTNFWEGGDDSIINLILYPEKPPANHQAPPPSSESHRESSHRESSNPESNDKEEQRQEQDEENAPRTATFDEDNGNDEREEREENQPETCREEEGEQEEETTTTTTARDDKDRSDISTEELVEEAPIAPLDELSAETVAEETPNETNDNNNDNRSTATAVQDDKPTGESQHSKPNDSDTQEDPTEMNDTTPLEEGWNNVPAEFADMTNEVLAEMAIEVEEIMPTLLSPVNCQDMVLATNKSDVDKGKEPIAVSTTPTETQGPHDNNNDCSTAAATLTTATLLQGNQENKKDDTEEDDDDKPTHEETETQDTKKNDSDTEEEPRTSRSIPPIQDEQDPAEMNDATPLEEGWNTVHAELTGMTNEVLAEMAMEAKEIMPTLLSPVNCQVNCQDMASATTSKDHDDVERQEEPSFVSPPPPETQDRPAEKDDASLEGHNAVPTKVAETMPSLPATSVKPMTQTTPECCLLVPELLPADSDHEKKKTLPSKPPVYVNREKQELRRQELEQSSFWSWMSNTVDVNAMYDRYQRSQLLNSHLLNVVQPRLKRMNYFFFQCLRAKLVPRAQARLARKELNVTLFLHVRARAQERLDLKRRHRICRKQLIRFVPRHKREQMLLRMNRELVEVQFWYRLADKRQFHHEKRVVVTSLTKSKNPVKDLCEAKDLVRAQWAKLRISQEIQSVGKVYQECRQQKEACLAEFHREIVPRLEGRDYMRFICLPRIFDVVALRQATRRQKKICLAVLKKQYQAAQLQLQKQQQILEVQQRITRKQKKVCLTELRKQHRTLQLQLQKQHELQRAIARKQKKVCLTELRTQHQALQLQIQKQHDLQRMIARKRKNICLAELRKEHQALQLQLQKQGQIFAVQQKIARKHKKICLAELRKEHEALQLQLQQQQQILALQQMIQQEDQEKSEALEKLGKAKATLPAVEYKKADAAIRKQRRLERVALLKRRILEEGGTLEPKIPRVIEQKKQSMFDGIAGVNLEFLSWGDMNGWKDGLGWE